MGLKKLLVGGACAVLAAQTFGLATAGATPTSEDFGGSKAQILGPVKIDSENPQIAYVTARYSCPDTGNPHLWVSVKQTESGRPDRALKGPESSKISAAWLQRHPDPATEFTCDGSWHKGTFAVDAGLSEYGFGALKPGQAYVQFCLLDEPPDETTPPLWFSSDQHFAAVK